MFDLKKKKKTPENCEKCSSSHQEDVLKSNQESKTTMLKQHSVTSTLEQEDVSHFYLIRLKRLIDYQKNWFQLIFLIWFKKMFLEWFKTKNSRKIFVSENLVPSNVWLFFLKTERLISYQNSCQFIFCIIFCFGSIRPAITRL